MIDLNRIGDPAVMLVRGEGSVLLAEPGLHELIRELRALRELEADIRLREAESGVATMPGLKACLAAVDAARKEKPGG